MSKTKGQTLQYRFGTKPKCFVLFFIENRLFQFGPESALLDQIEMITFDKTNLGSNSNHRFGFIPIRYESVCGMFVERLFLYCFDFTVLDLSTLQRPVLTYRVRAVLTPVL
jgi:hypothetical protein